MPSVISSFTHSIIHRASMKSAETALSALFKLKERSDVMALTHACRLPPAGPKPQHTRTGEAASGSFMLEDNGREGGHTVVEWLVLCPDSNKVTDL